MISNNVAIVSETSAATGDLGENISTSELLKLSSNYDVIFTDLETGRPLADGKVQHIIEHQGRKVRLRYYVDDGVPFVVLEIVMIMGMVVMVVLVVMMS